MARCKMCFKEKASLQPIRVGNRGTSNHVCKGCYYEIDKIVGFLSESGLEVAWPIKDQKDRVKRGVERGEKKES